MPQRGSSIHQCSQFLSPPRDFPLLLPDFAGVVFFLFTNKSQWYMNI